MGCRPVGVLIWSMYSIRGRWTPACVRLLSLGGSANALFFLRSHWILGLLPFYKDMLGAILNVRNPDTIDRDLEILQPEGLAKNESCGIRRRRPGAFRGSAQRHIARGSCDLPQPLRAPISDPHRCGFDSEYNCRKQLRSGWNRQCGFAILSSHVRSRPLRSDGRSIGVPQEPGHSGACHAGSRNSTCARWRLRRPWLLGAGPQIFRQQRFLRGTRQRPKAHGFGLCRRPRVAATELVGGGFARRSGGWLRRDAAGSRLDVFRAGILRAFCKICLSGQAAGNSKHDRNARGVA